MSDTEDEGPFNEAWELIEAEFEKANARLTPEVLKDREAIKTVFVELLRTSQEITRRLLPERDEMLIYNALYPDMDWNGSDDEATCELVNETAYEAEGEV
jgi:hypothetical protein